MTEPQTEQLQSLLRRWRDQRQLARTRLTCGIHNRISDVAGVSVGHYTLADGERQTGVTAIVPAGGNLYQQPLPCGLAVLNGFAKPVGLIQLAELGLLQTPILLGNTFTVGTLFTTLVRYSIDLNPQLGREQPTVNPVVLECNDGWLNDIQDLTISEAMAQHAITCASADFARGSVGAGRGMSCFSLKGGIGTASRLIPELNACLGVLVLANFGALSSFTINGVMPGDTIAPLLPELTPQQDAGSIIIIMATDAPLDARQLSRIARRAGAGLGRLGSYWGHGSGDIALAFSTQRTPQPPDDAQIDSLLCAAADATEHAVLDALLQAEPVRGFAGHYRPCLSHVLDQLVTRYLNE